MWYPRDNAVEQLWSTSPEALTAVLLKIQVFWDVIQCRYLNIFAGVSRTSIASIFSVKL